MQDMQKYDLTGRLEMNDTTLALAKGELAKYGLEAEIRLEEGLPSFEIRRIDGRTVIAAPSPVEALYGVYDLAERFGGYCFFEPGRDRFDALQKRALPGDGVVVAARRPLLKRRGFIQEFPFNEETPQLFDWMAKNKLNYLLVWMKYYDELPEDLKAMAQARGIVIESGHHNFSYWIPASKYAKTHPEFFAEIDGKRIKPSEGKGDLLLSEQLCTTNPELRSEIVRNMLDYCEKHPEVKVISLVPNDGFGWCECKECSKFYDKSEKGDFYSVSEHVYKANRIYHDLVKEVAARLHEKRPDIQLTFCAYVNYCEPAPGFRLTPGLAVHFAPYWRCINHLVDDPECYYNSNYAKDIMEWEAVKDGGEINIYEYYMGVNFYLSLPMVHFRELFHEMGWYEEHHVDGILTQFHIPHWSVYGLNYALMAKAARGESPQDAIPILFRSLFGNDGEAYLDFYWNVKEMLLHIGKCHIPHPYSLFKRTTLSQFKEIHRQAGELAARDPSNRLGREILVWTEYLVRFKSLFDDYHAGVLTEEMLDEFLAWIHSFRTTRVFVHERFDMYFQALRSCLRTGKPWVHFNIDWEDGYVIRETEMDGGK